jgi:hypothetical protein
VLGTLQVYPGQDHAGARLTFVLRPQLWQELAKPGAKVKLETLELEVLLFQRDDGVRYPAVQAHEADLPKLRRIPGFTER